MFDELLAPLFLTERGRQVGMGIFGVLSLLVFYAIIQMFTTWHADFILSQPKTASHEHAASIDTEAQLIAQIPAQHIFGAAADADSLPITSLHLRLTGILADANTQRSRVIISEGGDAGKVYRVGDSLPSSGLKIFAINADGVVLEREGHLEKLPLARPTLEFQPLPKALWETS